jgi:hypothetical protein
MLPLVSFVLYSSSPIDEIKRVLDNYITKNPQEKIFVHTDKPYYSSGDTLWFKAYLTAGLQNIPSTLSKVAYVQLLNEKSEVVKENTLKVTDGAADGYFVLGDSLNSAIYTIRSYTKWMLNFDSRFIPTIPIKIWNTNLSESQQSSSSQSNSAKSIDLVFLPEGGNLVIGQQSKVGFKAVDKSNKGVKLTGTIQTQNGEIVTKFEANEFGMGYFTLIPKRDLQYKAVLNDGQIFSLPTANEKGATIFVTNKPENADIIVKVQSTEPSEFYLVADTRGLLCHASKIQVKSGFAFAKIPKQNVLAGIAHITLFDQNLAPLAERLIFIEGPENESISVSSDKAVYQPREKVTINLQLPETPAPSSANLSASFFDSRSVYYDKHNLDIESFLLLTSELSGKVESPGYYFDRANPNRFDAQEALMLTQGWVRFTWSQIKNPDWPIIKYTPEQTLSLKGSLVDKFTNKPIEDGKVTYFEGATLTDGILSTRSAKDGSFIFNDLHVYDTSTHKILAENKRGNKEVVKINLVKDSIEFTKVNPGALESLRDFERVMIEKVIRNRSINKAYEDTKTIVLEGIEIKSTKTEKEPEIKVYGKGTNSVQASDIAGYQTFTSPLQLLQGRVPGVQVTGNGSSASVQIRGPGSVSASNDPLILFDNVPISISSINTIPVLSIESVEVFKGADAAIFGTQGANGVIAFYSKRGSDYTAKTPGSTMLSDWGYHLSRLRYEPKYDVKRAEHIKPDERIVIHWNPNIKIESKQNSSFHFFNADLETTVVGVIQGITNSGQPIVKTISFKVEK